MDNTGNSLPLMAAIPSVLIKEELLESEDDSPVNEKDSSLDLSQRNIRGEEAGEAQAFENSFTIPSDYSLNASILPCVPLLTEGRSTLSGTTNWDAPFKSLSQANRSNTLQPDADKAVGKSDSSPSVQVEEVNQAIAQTLSRITPPNHKDLFFPLNLKKEAHDDEAYSQQSLFSSVGIEQIVKRNQDTNIFAQFLQKPGENSASPIQKKSCQYVCAICSEVFDQEFILAVHMKLHSSLNSIESHQNVSKDLGKKKSESIEPNWVLQESKELPSGNQNSKEHICIICSKVFNKKFKLTIHMKLHSSLKPFECSDCGASFKTKSYLSKHMVSHSNLKRFQCSECNKQCKRKVDLNHHMLSHGTIRPFECIVCKRTFKSKAYLNQHLLVHSNPILFKQHADSYKAEGPIECAVCNKLFITPAQLRHHLPSHSDIKPYQCSQCHAGFKTKDFLKRHMASHNDTDPLQVAPSDTTNSGSRMDIQELIGSARDDDNNVQMPDLEGS